MTYLYFLLIPLITWTLSGWGSFNVSALVPTDHGVLITLGIYGVMSLFLARHLYRTHTGRTPGILILLAFGILSFWSLWIDSADELVGPMNINILRTTIEAVGIGSIFSLLPIGVFVLRSRERA